MGWMLATPNGSLRKASDRLVAKRWARRIVELPDSRESLTPDSDKLELSSQTAAAQTGPPGGGKSAAALSLTQWLRQDRASYQRYYRTAEVRVTTLFHEWAVSLEPLSK